MTIDRQVGDSSDVKQDGLRVEPASQSEQAVGLTNPLDRCGFSVFLYSSDVISLFFFPFSE